MGQSLKSSIDRSNLFDVPSYTKMIEIIKKIEDKPWVKPAIAILLATGCRVGELLYLKRGHIKFIDYNNKEIPNDNLILSEVAMIQFNLYTEKNKKSKHRIVPLIKNELFLDIVEIIVEYCKNIKYDDTLLFPYTRGAVWYAIKRNLGKDFFCHYIRHLNVTNDTRAGVSPVIQKTKFGWSDLRPHSVYAHLNYLDILNEQKKAFGEPSEKEKIYEVLDKNIEAREKYNEERNYKPPPIEEEKAVQLEKIAHPPPDPPKTKDDILLEKITEAIKELPETNIKKEEPIKVDIDKLPPPEPRKQYEPKFEPVGLEKQPENINFDRVKPEGAHLFKSGMIVNDKVVIVQNNKAKIEQIKQKYDPKKVIPVYREDPKYKARIKNLEKARQQKQTINDLVVVV